MVESDYILVRRLTSIRIARKIIADCINTNTKLQKVLRMLDEVLEECGTQFELD